MRIAVCEDEKASRDFECSLINKWAEQNQVHIHIDSYPNAENFLFEMEDKLEYDFLLLDIQMGKINGFELAKILRSRGFNGALAFLTGVLDYAVEGYEVGAVRYLLKPVKEPALFALMDAVYADVCKKTEEYFLLQTGGDILKIPFSQIIYIEARGHYVYLCGYGHANNGAGFATTEASGSNTGGVCDTKSNFFEKEWKAGFGEVTAGFDDSRFFGLRRGLLVNLEHVSKITRTECTLTNGEVLPVARNNYESLNRAFIDFYKSE